MTPRLSPVSFLRHCADVASFYGFVPLREIEYGMPARRGRGPGVPRGRRLLGQVGPDQGGLWRRRQSDHAVRLAATLLRPVLRHSRALVAPR